jgi:gas vesicle protein GvpL/GvpF
MPEHLWVYGVVSGQMPAPAQPGIDPGYRVQLIRAAGLAALVSRVGYNEYALRAALQDMDALETVARAHERVLDAALACGPVVPFRIGAVFVTETGVRDLLTQAQMAFVKTLARLRGHAEWGVKVYALHQVAAPAASTPPSSGTDYLARRSSARATAVRERHDVEELLLATHQQLTDHATETRVSPPLDGPLTRSDADMVLNAAYLVADADAHEFGAVAAQLARDARDRGMALELSGPWPAYHFSSLEP